MITNFEFLKVDDLTAELFQTANTAEKAMQTRTMRRRYLRREN